MRSASVVLVLVVAVVWSGAVVAAPNAGGVLVVHSSSLAYTSDEWNYSGQSGVACGQDEPSSECPPYNPSSPCNIGAASPTSTNPADVAQIWFVLAAFPDSSCPRLKAVGFGFQYNERWSGNSNGKIVIFDWGSDPDLAFQILWSSRFDSRAFPATGSSAALSFYGTCTSHLQELYWFAGYSYSDGTGAPAFELIGHENPLNAVFVDDTIPGALDSISGYGMLGFNGMAGSNPTPLVAHACCFEVSGQPVCEVLTTEQCAEVSGTPLDGFYCDVTIPDDVECGGPWTPGACCLPWGPCMVLTEGSCGELQGEWQGPLTDCSPNPCVSAAACCCPDGTCSITAEQECPTPCFWRWQWSSCDPNPCPDPSGACCVFGGFCILLAEDTCQQVGGAYQGNGTGCDPNPCPPPPGEGACCYTDGLCLFTIEVNCANIGGEWLGEGTDCEPNPCDQPDVLGACCTADGSCTYVIADDCSTGDWHEGVACDPNPCPPPVPVERTTWGRVKMWYR